MNISWQEILTHIAGFLIMLFLLKKFAWKPVLSLLDERKEKIEKGFKEIEETKQDVERLKVEYDKNLKEIEQTARQKIQESIKEAQTLSAGIQADAREESKKILAKARQNVQLEIARAKVELRDEMASIVISASEKLLREKLDGEKHKVLVARFVEELTEEKVAKNR